jgi:hypothetical protein
MKPFRAQIRSSLLALIMVVLLASNLLIYWGLQTLLQRFVDGRLLGLGETLVRLIEERPELLLTSESEIVPQKDERPDDEGLREVTHSIQVLALDGTVKRKAAHVLGGPPVSAEVLRQGKAGKIAYESVHTSTGMSLRRIFMPIRDHGEVQYLLQAEASLSLKEQTLRDLTALLVLSSVALIIVSWFGSDWVT